MMFTLIIDFAQSYIIIILESFVSSKNIFGYDQIKYVTYYIKAKNER